jgi:very-short-patch-repair endonuclease
MAERKLWWHLRHRLTSPASHFRRQVHLGRFIVDFASHTLKIVIEIDGGQHAMQIAKDAERTRFLESEGYRVLRFWNNDALGNIDGVLEMIQSAILPTSTPAPPHKGEGRN